MNNADLVQKLTARRAVLEQTIRNAHAEALLAEERAKMARATLAAEQGALDELVRTLALLAMQEPGKA